MGLAMRHIVFIVTMMASVAGSIPSRSEQQLPIDELFPCEVVLHELIAELRALRSNAVHTVQANHNEDANERIRSTAALQALDEAITIATRKMTRCPWVQ
jgi:hypothetical protein